MICRPSPDFLSDLHRVGYLLNGIKLALRLPPNPGMNCLRCQAQNAADARFCEECGARLALSCPSCGAPVVEGKKFCRSCGAALSPSASSVSERFASLQHYIPKHLAERILTSKSTLEGERKQVMVVFADLKGSMELYS